uniref:Transmembrane protein 240b n=1 Tax=Echeneis naucrates TaxID=173247 RepID=A0A665TA41_ECHNA
IGGPVGVSVLLPDMNALHNFIMLLVYGQDRVCACTCGRSTHYHTYHVIPYYGDEMEVDSRENHFINYIKAQQEFAVIAGLLLGLCIGWFLWWLDGVCCSWLRYRRKNKTKGNYILNTEESEGNTVHALHHNVSGL